MRSTFTKKTSFAGIFILVVLVLSANVYRTRFQANSGPEVLRGVALADKLPAVTPTIPTASAVKESPKPDNNPKSDNGQKLFFISGNISGLAPGVENQLAVTITNPHNSVIDVQSLAASVTSVDPAHSSCPGSSVTVDPYQGHIAVAKSGTAATQLPIRLSASAPNSCQGAQFTLGYTGTAVKP
jgi:hypothetical protein